MLRTPATHLPTPRIPITSQLMWIIADADSQRSTPPTVAEASIAALTGEDRTVWVNVRSEFFATGLNRQSLDMIERAVFVLSLDHEDHPGTPEKD